MSRSSLAPSTQRPIARSGGGVNAFALERASFTEHHLSAAVPGDAPGHDAAGALLDSLAAVAAERRLEPVQEKLYGLVEARDELLERRRVAWTRHGLDPSLPVTFLEGRPLGSGPLAGAQLSGITPGPRARVTTIGEGAARGRCVEAPGLRLVHLPFVRGLEPDGALAKGATRQLDRMFANAEAALAVLGLSYGDVVRTWIYVARLLDVYGDLNRVRTARYAPFGFGSAPGDRPFPASTGIQGRAGPEECFMDVLALDPASSAVELRPLTRSARQGESFSYGSAFSRGMSIGLEGRRTIHVSGTASIDAAGRTVHVGDPEKQVVEMLLSVAALLEREGTGLEGLVSATLFVKDRAAFDAWGRVARLLRLPPLPVVAVLADVCRPELLVELEAVAVV